MTFALVPLGGTYDARAEYMRTIAAAPALVTLVLLVSACATGLAPAPGSRKVFGAGEGAVTEVAGVRVEARAEAWRRFPRNLNEAVTPFLVRIDNHGGGPLQVAPPAFALVDEAGNPLAAAPAGAIDAIVREERLLLPLASPGYPSTVSPYGAMVGPRGFVYFPRPRRAIGDVVFEARLVRGDTAELIGVATIPFVEE